MMPSDDGYDSYFDEYDDGGFSCLLSGVIISAICRGETRPRKAGLFSKGPFYATMCLLGVAVLYCATSQNNFHPQQPVDDALAGVLHHSVSRRNLRRYTHSLAPLITMFRPRSTCCRTGADICVGLSSLPGGKQ